MPVIRPRVSWEIWRVLAGFGKLWRVLAGFGKLWRVLAGFSKLWWVWAGSSGLMRAVSVLWRALTRHAILPAHLGPYLLCTG